MLGDDEITDIQDQIKALEEQLQEKKRQLHENKYRGLQDALVARKEAEKMVREELKKLGLSYMKGNWVF